MKPSLTFIAIAAVTAASFGYFMYQDITAQTTFEKRLDDLLEQFKSGQLSEDQVWFEAGKALVERHLARGQAAFAGAIIMLVGYAPIGALAILRGKQDATPQMEAKA
jgi:hypothetical protein